MSDYVTQEQLQRILAKVTAANETSIIQSLVACNLAIAAITSHPNPALAIALFEQMIEPATTPLLFSTTSDKAIDQYREAHSTVLKRLRTIFRAPSPRQ